MPGNSMIYANNVTFEVVLTCFLTGGSGQYIWQSLSSELSPSFPFNLAIAPTSSSIIHTDSLLLPKDKQARTLPRANDTQTHACLIHQSQGEEYSHVHNRQRKVSK